MHEDVVTNDGDRDLDDRATAETEPDTESVHSVHQSGAPDEVADPSHGSADDATEQSDAAGDAGDASGDAGEPAVDAERASTATGDADVDLDKQGDIAADYLEGLLDILDLDGDIDLDIEAGRALVSVVEARSGELTHLVGDDGEVLAALQDLTRLAVTQQAGERSRLILDIAGHRARRRDGLRKIGEAAVAEAKESGNAVRLAAMSAFERKVIHDVVAEAGLTSESEGAEPRRYVVVMP